MCMLTALLFMAGNVADVGDAPAATLRPSEEVGRFVNVFNNCEFDAVETSHLAAPSGIKRDLVVDVRAAVSKDAVLTKKRRHIKEVMTSDGERDVDLFGCEEESWTRTGGWRTIELGNLVKDRWPTRVPIATGEEINAVFVQEPAADDRIRPFIESLVINFIGSVRGSGITLTDMVTDGGKGTYRLSAVKWLTADHRSVAYTFRSKEYGAVTVTFARMGAMWLPTLIQIVKTAGDKMYDKGGEKSTLEHFQRFRNEFRGRTLGFDRWEMLYDIRYRSASSPDRPLPQTIKATESGFVGNAQSVLSTTLEFTTIRCGGITSDKVCKAMLPLPDACMVFMGKEKVAWTTRNGEIVKKIDDEALELGRSVALSSGPRVTYLIVANGFVLAMLGVFYIRRRLAGGVGK
jgi:hypothetical protein